MEEKKRTKKKKKQESQRLLFLLLGLAVVALLVLLIGTKIFPQKDYFEVKDRAAQVEDADIVHEDHTYEAVGWIRVQGTNIDYPIIYDENAYEVGYPVQKDHYGWLSNFEPGYGQYMEISGHNIFNLSEKPVLHHDLFTRFEELMDFLYYDFAKENKYIQLTYDGEEYVYKIFAVALVPPTEVSFFPYTIDFSKDDAQEYLNLVDKYNMYKYKVDVNKNDNLISLVTCTRIYGEEESYELRVVGRLVRKGEKIKNYPVEKGKLYKDIEENLKGDDEDDEEEV